MSICREIRNKKMFYEMTSEQQLCVKGSPMNNVTLFRTILDLLVLSPIVRLLLIRLICCRHKIVYPLAFASFMDDQKTTYKNIGQILYFAFLSDDPLCLKNHGYLWVRPKFIDIYELLGGF